MLKYITTHNHSKYSAESEKEIYSTMNPMAPFTNEMGSLVTATGEEKKEGRSNFVSVRGQKERKVSLKGMLKI